MGVSRCSLVMAGHSRLKDGVASARLCPGIHAFRAKWQDVDGRVKPGHDDADRHLLAVIVTGWRGVSSRNRCDIRLGGLVPIDPVDLLQPFLHGLLQVKRKTKIVVRLAGRLVVRIAFIADPFRCGLAQRPVL